MAFRKRHQGAGYGGILAPPPGGGSRRQQADTYQDPVSFPKLDMLLQLFVRNSLTLI